MYCLKRNQYQWRAWWNQVFSCVVSVSAALSEFLWCRPCALLTGQLAREGTVELSALIRLSGARMGQDERVSEETDWDGCAQHPIYLGSHIV